MGLLNQSQANRATHHELPGFVWVRQCGTLCGKVLQIQLTVLSNGFGTINNLKCFCGIYADVPNPVQKTGRLLFLSWFLYSKGHCASCLDTFPRDSDAHTDIFLL